MEPKFWEVVECGTGGRALINMAHVIKVEPVGAKADKCLVRLSTGDVLSVVTPYKDARKAILGIIGQHSA